MVSTSQLKKALVGVVALAAIAGGVVVGSGSLSNGTKEAVASSEVATSGVVANVGHQTADTVRVARAHAVFQHIRNGTVIWTGDAYNVKTTVGIDFTFSQTYGTAAQANGLNYIALSNDSLTETSASTTLSNEISANGLGRAQGTYAHTAGTSTVTISKTFTCATGAQSAQKAALFSASSGGTMHHALAFTQRTLQIGDQLAVTFTITIT